MLLHALWLPAAHTLYERRQLDLCLGRAAPVTPHHGATGSSFGAVAGVVVAAVVATLVPARILRSHPPLSLAAIARRSRPPLSPAAIARCYRSLLSPAAIARRYRSPLLPATFATAALTAARTSLSRPLLAPAARFAARLRRAGAAIAFRLTLKRP